MKNYLRQLPDGDVVDKIQKLNSSDYFELVYMRHNYFRNSVNPAPGRLESFEEMLTNISNKIYFRNIQVFKDVGFEPEDLINISRVHTVSFISMSGLYENDDRMKKFIKRHKNIKGKDSEPTEKDIFTKECYDLARFLNQRIQEVALFCQIKNNNIRGTRSMVSYYVGKPNKQTIGSEIVRNPKLFGFTKITKKEYVDFKKEHNPKNDNEFKIPDGRVVKVVHLQGNYLSKRDIENIGLSPKQNMFYSNPEDNLIEIEKLIDIDNKLKQLKK